MNSFLKGRGAGKGGQGGGNGECVAELREDYPLLASCLVGFTGQTAGDSLPCSTIMVFLDGGRMKFCLSPQSGPDVAFGVVDDPVKVWESIERALREAAIEWKRRKRES